RVQQAIEQVFRLFRQTRSIRQTCLWFQRRALELPVNKRQRATTRVGGALPAEQFICFFFYYPFYAWAYFLWARPTHMVVGEGKVTKRTAPWQRPEDCRVCIPDHHEGYIDWGTFEDNRRIMQHNVTKTDPDEAVGAVRAGKAL